VNLAPRGRAIARWLGIAGGLYVLGLLTLAATPLSRVFGYEFAAGSCALLCTAGVVRGAGRAGNGGVWTSFFAASRDLALLATISLSLGVGTSLWVETCDVGAGLRYHAVLVWGGIPWAAGVVVFARRCLPRWPRAMAVGTIAVSAVGTLAFLALQPPIVVHTPILGYYAGSIYDESLQGIASHGWYRLYTSAAAIAWVALLSFAERRGVRDGALGGVCAAVAISVWGWRGELSVERDRAWIERELGGYTTTDHFEIFYDAKSYDARRLRLLIEEHEARYAEMAEFFETHPTRRLRSYVYGSNARRGDLMGGYRTMVAKIWLSEMHLTWGGPGTELLAHELAHLFLRDDGRGPLRLSARWGLFPNMALVEGAATAAAWGANDLDYHAWSAALFQLDLGASIATILGPRGFWTQSSGRAYTLAGSFCRWLVETRGPVPFRAAYGSGDFEGAYGAPLLALEAEWRAWLLERPLDESVLEVARFRYDRPSIFGRRCARAVSTTLDEARTLVVGGSADRLDACVDRVLAMDPENVRLRYDVALLEVAGGRTERALARVRGVADEEGAGMVLRMRAREVEADILWSRGAYDEALQRYAALLASAAVPADRRRIRSKVDGIEALAEAPLTAAAVRRHLIERPSPARLLTVAELTDAWARERRPVAAWLAASLLAPEGSPLVEALLTDEMVESLDEDRGLSALELLAVWHTTDGDPARGCDVWRRVVSRAAHGTKTRASAVMWVSRCEREDVGGVHP
jgi:hypothetical protein